jgi:hypothetical protein
VLQELKANAEKWVSDASVTDHYNLKLHRCFLEVQVIKNRKANIPGGPGEYLHRYVSDAFEKKMYAQAIWKLGQEPSLVCEATLPSGEKRTCTTTAELETLVKIFMEH